MLLQVFYSIRSERQLMEQVQYNLLFRWFIGLSMDDVVWVPTVFTKNRERLIEHDVVVALFNEIVLMADAKGWLSGEHFTVAGFGGSQHAPVESHDVSWRLFHPPSF
jgi:transposase